MARAMRHLSLCMAEKREIHAIHMGDLFLSVGQRINIGYTKRSVICKHLEGLGKVPLHLKVTASCSTHHENSVFVCDIWCCL